MLATGLWPAQCALPGATVALDAVGELVVLSLQLLDLEKRAPVLVSKSSEVFRVAVDETDLFHEAKQTPGVDVHEVPFHLADRHDVEEFHRFLGTVDRLAVAAHQNVVPQQRRLVADRLQPTLADTLVGSETQGRAMKADDLVHLLSHRKHACRALRWQLPSVDRVQEMHPLDIRKALDVAKHLAEPPYPPIKRLPPEGGMAPARGPGATVHNDVFQFVR